MLLFGFLPLPMGEGRGEGEVSGMVNHFATFSERIEYRIGLKVSMSYHTARNTCAGIAKVPRNFRYNMRHHSAICYLSVNPLAVTIGLVYGE